MFSTFLYRHFDKKGALLYVGVTKSAFARLSQHRSKSVWAREIHRITYEQFDDHSEALRAETNAIRSESPIHNKRGRPNQRRLRNRQLGIRISKRERVALLEASASDGLSFCAWARIQLNRAAKAPKKRNKQ